MSQTPQRSLANGYHAPRAANGVNGSAQRRGGSMARDGSIGGGLGAEEEEREEDAIHVLLKQRWEETEANLMALFGGGGEGRRSWILGMRMRKIGMRRSLRAPVG